MADKTKNCVCIFVFSLADVTKNKQIWKISMPMKNNCTDK